MQSQIIHPIPLVPVQTVGLLFLLVITGRWTDLQGVNHTCGASHSVDPVPIEIETQVLVLGFRIYYKDFCPFHKLGQNDMFDGCGFPHTGISHNDKITVSAVSAPAPGIHNHQAAAGILGEVVPLPVIEPAAGKGKAAYKS